MIFAFLPAEAELHQIQKANQSTSGFKWMLLLIPCGVVFEYLWGEAGGICNITSLILCRFHGKRGTDPRFRRSIHLYQWDPENRCCMAQTSWLLVNQMSILPVIQRTDSEQKTFSKGILAVLETWVFWKGKKQQNVQERSFLFPWHPNTVWEGLLGIFLWSKYFLSRCLDV